jgi:spore coat protein CotH
VRVRTVAALGHRVGKSRAALTALAVLWTGIGGCVWDSPHAAPRADAGSLGDAAARADAASGGVVCAPTFGGPVWSLEGDPLEIVVRCSTDLDLPGSSFAIDPLPDGAEYEPATGRLRWTPGLDQAAVYTVAVAVAALDEQVRLQIGIVDRWDDPENVPVDPFTYTEEYGLPVFHLQTSEKLNDDEHTPAQIVYRGRDHAGAQAKYRGDTSLEYPKKSFTLKLASDHRLSDPERGLHDERRVVLTTTFDDNSHLRQRLAYGLWNRLGADHIQITAFNAVLYLNGHYHGLYVVTDHVDDDLMEDSGLWRYGNLYKARSHEANLRLTTNDGAPKTPLHLGYTKEEGAPADGTPHAYADLDALLTWLSSAPAEEFYDRLDQHVDRTEFEDWWMFVSLIGAVDSAGKNSYLYHDPRSDSPTPLWRYVPWDFNASFGQSYQTHRLSPGDSPELVARRNGLFERMLMEPRLRKPLLERYDAVLHDACEVETVIAWFDAWVREIDASALRDEQKWSDAVRAYDWKRSDEFTTYTEEVEYVRAWIRERWDAVDALF